MIETALQTRSDWVYERLKQAIVSGELPQWGGAVGKDVGIGRPQAKNRVVTIKDRNSITTL